MIPPSWAISGNNRVFPASVDDAVRLFPDLILLFAMGKLKVTSVFASEHPSYLLENPSALIKILVLEQDFLLIKKISLSFGPPLSVFPSEPMESIKSRARAMVRVEFAGRGAF